jgi:hypothetical protein
VFNATMLIFNCDDGGHGWLTRKQDVTFFEFPSHWLGNSLLIKNTLYNLSKPPLASLRMPAQMICYCNRYAGMKQSPPFMRGVSVKANTTSPPVPLQKRRGEFNATMLIVNCNDYGHGGLLTTNITTTKKPAPHFTKLAKQQHTNLIAQAPPAASLRMPHTGYVYPQVRRHEAVPAVYAGCFNCRCGRWHLGRGTSPDC